MEVGTAIMVMRVSSTTETSGVALLWEVMAAGPLTKTLCSMVEVIPRTDGRSLGVSPGSLTPLESQRPVAYLNESC